MLPINGTYYVFGSNSSARMPITPVTNLGQSFGFFPWIGITKEGMTQRPPWAINDTFWAPTAQLFAGGYVAFFSAPVSADRQCIGRA
ncbi:MAG: hypothetical protein ACT4PI_09730, partial [Actinomycetota bacterium]